MVVYVSGTGCHFFVENDHELGCAASVEHTPHPLGRPRSYHTSLAKMSFDQQFDLTAGVYFHFL